MKNILVTGGAGYIGSILVPKLLDTGHKVTVIDNFMFQQASLNHVCHSPNLSIVKGDIRIESVMSPLLKKADIVIPLAAYSAKKEKNLVNYPQIRAKVWTKKTFRLNLIGWAVYLVGYELLFRGILLFPLVEAYGIWLAIAVNVALYSATHIPKGLDETLGAAPLGFVLCLLTLMSGNIWISVLVHIGMAWTNSLTALKHHPAIHYNRQS